MIKIATWNLCLGLKKKKDYVYDTIRKEKIDVCMLQEVEINKDYPINILTAKDYKIEIEKNDTKARVAIIVNNDIEYERLYEYERPDLGVIAIDLNVKIKYRLINVYRQFNPQHNLTQSEHFTLQLNTIKTLVENAQNRNIIIAGDFNLDDDKRYSVDYRYKNLFEIQNQIFEQLNLIQIIQFKTWQRIVLNTIRESVLDHVYVNDPSYICDIASIKPLTGDHKLIMFDIIGKKIPQKILMKRDWSKYSKETLETHLEKVNFKIDTDDPQTSWNIFENFLLPVIDEIVPLVPFLNNQTQSSLKEPKIINQKLNLRKKLLKKLKNEKTNLLRDRVKNLNHEIRSHFLSKKSKTVRRNIRPGNSKSLWDAVKIAKDINISKMPSNMTLNNIKINPFDLPDSFATHFAQKTQAIVNNQVVNDNVFNGTKKVECPNIDFMQEVDVIKAIKSLNPKNSEGHDRIPVRIVVDGVKFLAKPLSLIFKNIYATKIIPEQWLIAKIIPIFKKGASNKIENYRPISNLCACSKVFEKLILNRIKNIEILNKVDLTSKSQHGFKSNHSTLTAGLKIQSLIARALDDDMYVLMASLDLSSAFDVVNVELLIKRLNIIGLPSDVVMLISNWLTTRYFYVSVDGNNSYIHGTSVGTVQGSILGPMLYSLFVSPLTELEKITLFADDNYILVWNKNKDTLSIDMQNKLNRISTWLSNSGLKVNETKTELCLFHRNDHPPIHLEFNDEILTTKNNMNVLGVSFDSKLNWQSQVEQTIQKSRRALHAINLIKRYFNKKELLQLVTSNYYSILYYNSEIWHIPSLTLNLKKNLLSASAAALKICVKFYDSTTSFASLHAITNRAEPNKIMQYKLAILLFKVINSETTSWDFFSLFFNQNFNERNPFINFRDTSHYKVGKNILTNRFPVLNNKIDTLWLNQSLSSYKIKCKNSFL